MRRNLDHLYVQGFVVPKDFNRKGGGARKLLRRVDRRAHGIALKNDATRVFSTFDERIAGAGISDEELRATGTIVVLEGEGSTYPLKVDSLNSFTGGKSRKPKWLLLSAREAQGEKPEIATVWVSDSYREQFIKLFEDYINDEKNTKTGRPKNQDLVANISRIRKAVIDALWTSEM